MAQGRSASSGAGSTASETPPPGRRTSKCRWQPSGAPLSETRANTAPRGTRSPGPDENAPGVADDDVAAVDAQQHRVVAVRRTQRAGVEHGRGLAGAQRRTAGDGHVDAVVEAVAVGAGRVGGVVRRGGAAERDHDAVPAGEPRRGVPPAVGGVEPPARVRRPGLGGRGRCARRGWVARRLSVAVAVVVPPRTAWGRPGRRVRAGVESSLAQPASTTRSATASSLTARPSRRAARPGARRR